MHIVCEAIVVAVRPHGEHGAVVRVLTAECGLLAGYVRGGRSRQLRPVLMAGNGVLIDLRARTETQLAAMTVELMHGRAGLIGEPLAAAALEWSTALVAAALPEGQAYPRIHAALDGVLTALESASSARDWVGALAGYERVVLAELGYGVAPAEAEVAGNMGVSPTPNSSAGVKQLGVLRANGHRLAENILTERRARPLDARDRLVERLARALG